MMKTVVVLNGEIYHVGEWDFQIFEDEEGNEIIGNPLPEGATIEEREMEYTEENGWREVGWSPPKSENEILKNRLEATEIALMELMMEG